MSCRRASEIDLPGFLDDPQKPELAEFRAHYPRCAECAAELRAWSALREALREARGEAPPLHPEPEQLARYDEAPAALGAGERRALEAHLAGCAACRDELRALRAFDPGALAAAAPAPRAAGPARKPAGAGWLAALRRLLWHPAFAYALVCALLLPTLYRQLAFEARVPAAPTEAKPGAPPSDAEDRAARWAAEPAPARRELERVATPPATALRAERKLEEIARSKAAAAARAEPAARPLAAPRLGGAGRAAEGAASRASELDEAEAVSQVLRLQPGEIPLVSASAGALQLLLTLPRAPDTRAEVEIRLLGPGARRELRERRTLAAGASSLSLEVPAGWLVAGRHEVELSALEGGRAVARERYAFDVPPAPR
jgi:hypothetical protein